MELEQQVDFSLKISNTVVSLELKLKLGFSQHHKKNYDYFYGLR